MNNLEELMLDRIIKQAEKIVEQNLRIKELEQQLAIVQEREATRDHPPIDQAEQHAQAAEAMAEAESLPKIPEGFIRHDGSGCPVSDVTKVIIILANGYESPVNNAGAFYWPNDSRLSDIIAYKVIEE